MRTLTLEEVVKNCREYNEKGLLGYQQPEVKNCMYVYPPNIGGGKCRCAIGASLNEEEIKYAANTPGINNKSFFLRFVQEGLHVQPRAEDATEIYKLQRRHDDIITGFQDFYSTQEERTREFLDYLSLLEEKLNIRKK